ncbi:TetR/AcrR family transcriptional repressor of nem operon [Tardiphaga robiniae]|uniref:TetR/AcrR family transcriptional regulator n=1 Tax=Tardiphaga robiniae TaxID=943830 RepID=UPI00286630DF|nr:TetR/AcrR family transcriptional regulator [Tardiphaga robiniae]MDR6660847.1 TetR/AcrR family transcriptional repressor of nem operon [Tardiphaga robiniae]
MRLVDLSGRLFRKRGLDGATVGDVMEAAGLTHGGFYNYFAAKSALQTACIEEATQTTLDELERTPNTQAGRSSYIASYLSAARRDDPEGGCIIALLGSELTRDALLRPLLSNHIAAVVGKMAAALPWDGRSKRSEALRALTLMVGAMVLARAVEEAALSDEILDQARAALRGRAPGQ